MNRTLLLGLSVLSLVLVATPAYAQVDSASVLGPQRDGFTMGATFGRGSIEVACDTCVEATLTEALSVSAHAGYMITPRLALLGEHWTVRYNARGGPLFNDNERHLVAQHMSTVAAQLFVTNRLWIKAGVGVGWHITDGEYDNAPKPRSTVGIAANGSASPVPSDEPEDEGSAGAASFAAIGWELAHNSVFACDIQFRVGATKRHDARYEVYNTGLNIGFNWY